MVLETPRTAGNVWTPGCVSNTGSDSFVEDLRDASNGSAVECFNEAMANEPYERVSLRQIKMARAHAKTRGPGSIVPKVINHRVRLDTSKVEHFVHFINRPYFYQDVAFGTRTSTLDDGRQVTMPNVVRTITRSTMIKQYLE